ncbi:hypothetical protein N7472_007552, partial [Penicillium cf. griseofulvum]
IGSLAAAIPLRRHDSQPEGWKAHHSIHSFAIDLSASYLGAQLSLDILLILALTHSQTRPDPPGLLLSTPLLPCPYPISPLTFATTEVSFNQTTKNAIESLSLNTPRGIIPGSLALPFSAFPPHSTTHLSDIAHLTQSLLWWY